MLKKLKLSFSLLLACICIGNITLIAIEDDAVLRELQEAQMMEMNNNLDAIGGAPIDVIEGMIPSQTSTDFYVYLEAGDVFTMDVMALDATQFAYVPPTDTYSKPYIIEIYEPSGTRLQKYSSPTLVSEIDSKEGQIVYTFSFTAAETGTYRVVQSKAQGVSSVPHPSTGAVVYLTDYEHNLYFETLKGPGTSQAGETVYGNLWGKSWSFTQDADELFKQLHLYGVTQFGAEFDLILDNYNGWGSNIKVNSYGYMDAAVCGSGYQSGWTWTSGDGQPRNIANFEDVCDADRIKELIDFNVFFSEPNSYLPVQSPNIYDKEKAGNNFIFPEKVEPSIENFSVELDMVAKEILINTEILNYQGNYMFGIDYENDGVIDYETPLFTISGIDETVIPFSEIDENKISYDSIFTIWSDSAAEIHLSLEDVEIVEDVNLYTTDLDPIMYYDETFVDDISVCDPEVTMNNGGLPLDQTQNGVNPLTSDFGWTRQAGKACNEVGGYRSVTTTGDSLSGNNTSWGDNTRINVWSNTLLDEPLKAESAIVPSFAVKKSVVTPEIPKGIIDGDDIVYQIAIANTGELPLYGTMTDPLDDLEFASQYIDSIVVSNVTGEIPGSYNGDTDITDGIDLGIDIIDPDVPGSGIATIELTVSTKDNTDLSFSDMKFTNIASFQPDEIDAETCDIPGDLNSGNCELFPPGNSNEVEVPIEGPIFTPVKSSNITTAENGNSIIYSLAVTNSGGSGTVEIKDDMSDNEFTEGLITDITITGTGVTPTTISVSELQQGVEVFIPSKETATITYTYTIPAQGISDDNTDFFIHNTLEINPDPDPDGDGFGECFKGTCESNNEVEYNKEYPTIELLKTMTESADTNSTIQINEIVTYTLDVTNTSTIIANDVLVKDELTEISAAGANFDVSNVDAKINDVVVATGDLQQGITIPVLLPNETATVSFEVTYDENSNIVDGQTINNIASAAIGNCNL